MLAIIRGSLANMCSYYMTETSKYIWNTYIWIISFLCTCYWLQWSTLSCTNLDGFLYRLHILFWNESNSFIMYLYICVCYLDKASWLNEQWPYRENITERKNMQPCKKELATFCSYVEVQRFLHQLPSTQSILPPENQTGTY